MMIVGLGNPGRRYEGTRHNLGFMVIDHLAAAAGGRLRKDWRLLGRAMVAEVAFRGCPAVLVKPLTYVNRSGAAAGPLAARFRVPAKRVLAVCDDMALEFGRTRLRERGSAGGHNGLQSLIGVFGEGFPRLRVGIGAPARPAEWSDYVLGPFSGEETAGLPALIERAAGEAVVFVTSKRHEEET